MSQSFRADAPHIVCRKSSEGVSTAAGKRADALMGSPTWMSFFCICSSFSVRSAILASCAARRASTSAIVCCCAVM